MYILVIAPLSSIELKAGVSAGNDFYDHYGVLIRSTTQVPVIIPAINVDPSVRSNSPALAYGSYRLLKAKHRWKHPKGDMDGFFVCRKDGFPEDMHWQKVHTHPIRENLPGYTRGGVSAPIKHINIHQGGEGKESYDWSDGCITMPKRYMDTLYYAVSEGEKGYLVFYRNHLAAADAAKQILGEII